MLEDKNVIVQLGESQFWFLSDFPEQTLTIFSLMSFSKLYLNIFRLNFPFFVDNYHYILYLILLIVFIMSHIWSWLAAIIFLWSKHILDQWFPTTTLETTSASRINKIINILILSYYLALPLIEHPIKYCYRDKIYQCITSNQVLVGIYNTLWILLTILPLY